jgi:hypothetical protein
MNTERGESTMARRHEQTAERHGEAAVAAEALRQLDVAVEGDQLDD